MEKQNFVRDGAEMKLPVGFRFHPTDEELIVHYLKRKVYSLPLPASIIPEVDQLFQTNPWDLPGDSKEKRYFFCKRKRNVNKCCYGVTESGYWKGTGGKEKYVLAAAGSNRLPVVVGVKKSLIFCQRKRPRGLPLKSTQWVMHEYSLVGSQFQTSPYSTQQLQKFKMETEADWVVCRIYQKKRKCSKNNGDKARNFSSTCSNKTRNSHGHVPGCDINIRPSIIHHDLDLVIMEESNYSGPPQSSSRSSSGITRELSSEGLKSDDQEETSCASPACVN